MAETGGSARLETLLDAYGADLGRWPQAQATAARALLLSDRAFRRDFDDARRLDAALQAGRSEMDARIEGSEAMARLRERTRGGPPHVAGLRLNWRRVAAAVLVAGLLGGTFDSVLMAEQAQTQAVVLVDPILYGPDEAELQ
jgi:hypothetical protein